MHRRGGTRLATAGVVVGVCAFAIVRGLDIVAFVEARARVNSGDAPSEAVRPWIGVSGLAGAALRASLDRAAMASNADAARGRADDLTALLSVQALSSSDWLSLAGMRYVEGKSYEDVLAALMMSWLTGPNEGSVMWQRGVFGLLQWDFLPLDARKRTLCDLAISLAGGIVDSSEAKGAKSILDAKPPEARLQITSLLQEYGVPPTALLRLGL